MGFGISLHLQLCWAALNVHVAGMDVRGKRAPGKKSFVRDSTFYKERLTSAQRSARFKSRLPARYYCLQVKLWIKCGSFAERTKRSWNRVRYQGQEKAPELQKWELD